MWARQANTFVNVKNLDTIQVVQSGSDWQIKGFKDNQFVFYLHDVFATEAEAIEWVEKLIPWRAP